MSYHHIQTCVTTLLLILTYLTDVISAGSYCVFLHEDYYTYRTIYCGSGCCRDYGEDDDICCFTWSVGVILGIAFACVGFIVMVIVAVVCCHQMKKRSGHVIHPSQPVPQNNTVVYTTAAPTAPPYPYQAQPSYIPGSHYTAYSGVAPPPYTAGTLPAYMPAKPDQLHGSHVQRPTPGAQYPPPTYGHEQPPTTMGTSNPVYPPANAMYGGYGAGPTDPGTGNIPNNT